MYWDGLQLTAILLNHLCEALYCALTGEDHAAVFPGLSLGIILSIGIGIGVGFIELECAGCEQVPHLSEVLGVEAVF